MFCFDLFILRLTHHGLRGIFLQLAHYLSGFMKNTTDLSTKASRFKLEASMLRVAKDKLLKIAREASDRANTVEKKA